jgi:hypothetical protein
VKTQAADAVNPKPPKSSSEARLVKLGCSVYRSIDLISTFYYQEVFSLLKTTTDLWDKELWTQNEVAQYFRVVPGTIKNWRDQGYLSYYQVPGSSRVLYFRDEIKDLVDKNSVKRKGGDNLKIVKKAFTEVKRVKPIIPSSEKEWRI